MARLFAALDLDRKVADRLGEECDRLRLVGAPVRWVPPKLMHVTVRFLGETSDDELVPLCRTLDECAAGHGELRLLAKGLGHFPEGKPPRVLWCGVEGKDEDEDEMLRDLFKEVDRGVRRLGFRPQKGAVRPHVTLGRLREPPEDRELLDRVGVAARRPFGHFRVEAVVLYESQRDREGSVYVPIHRSSLR